MNLSEGLSQQNKWSVSKWLFSDTWWTMKNLVNFDKKLLETWFWQAAFRLLAPNFERGNT